MKLAVSKDLKLPDDAVTQTFVVFGKRGSGKSNTGVVLAEEMHRAGGQIIVLDPVGAWWGLKSSFDGSGPGLPVYIFGGTHGDLPLQPTAGQLMAQVAIAHRIPMVLDMSGWAGAERARFVTAFATWLLGHNDRTPVHVFLEEAFVSRLGKAPRLILAELLSDHPNAVPREELAERTGYHPRTPGFANGLGQLRGLGLVDGYGLHPDFARLIGR